jgi:hypothetical protein
MRAYIVFKVEPQHTAQLMHDLKTEEAIVQASLIHGPYDCVAEVEEKDLQGINDLVMRLRTRQGVKDTMTCLVIQSWRKP